ncbi:hypothetical protein OA90_27445 [Labrenzia sp. OB1]|nr:hypothetical protein OA90_27445 [Labrenzia sp. OB1]
MSGYAMADLVEPPQFLDVQMDEVPGTGPLITAHGFGRCETIEAVQPPLFQGMSDGRSGELQETGNFQRRKP